MSEDFDVISEISLLISEILSAILLETTSTAFANESVAIVSDLFGFLLIEDLFEFY